MSYHKTRIGDKYDGGIEVIAMRDNHRKAILQPAA